MRRAAARSAKSRRRRVTYEGATVGVHEPPAPIIPWPHVWLALVRVDRRTPLKRDDYIVLYTKMARPTVLFERWFATKGLLWTKLDAADRMFRFRVVRLAHRACATVGYLLWALAGVERRTFGAAVRVVAAFCAPQTWRRLSLSVSGDDRLPARVQNMVQRYDAARRRASAER
jgi:hypothetical protein